MSRDTLESLKIVLASPEFVELKESALMRIDLKYATAANFMNENVYGEFNRAFLHAVAFEKLMTAVKFLKEKKPEYKFIIYDTLRPRSVQSIMWNRWEGPNREDYIANPEKGSSHNFGMAVDLSILDESEKVLDMGTGFDDFDELSEPRQEERFLAELKLTPEQIANRKLLRTCMERAGFRQLSTEWWHFEALPLSEVRANFRIVE
jgi:D-alanyl-D-alanine dipeptidase